MNILILNAFGSDKKALEQFKEFEKIIKSTFNKAFKDKGIIDNITFHVKDLLTIDEFLFDKNSPFCSFESLRNFERLDFIFADGVEKYLPWEKNGYKLAVLMKMCMKYEKSTFLFGIGLQLMVYLIATHFLINFNIINSKIDLSSLEELNLIEEHFLVTLTSKDFFLDHVTGDLYSYRNESNEWIPKMNIGLHNRLIAENIPKRGKYVLSKSQYRPLSSQQGGRSYSVLGTEKKTFITKNFKNHRLFEDLSNELLCESQSEWYAHYFNLKNKSLTFNILLVNDYGPSLIEYKSCYGSNFRVKKETQDVQLILYNFIKNELEDIYMGVKVKLRFDIKNEFDNSFEGVTNKMVSQNSLTKTMKTEKNNQLQVDEENKALSNYNNALDKRPISSAKPRNITFNRLNSGTQESHKDTILKEMTINNTNTNTNDGRCISAIKYRVVSGKSPVKIFKHSPMKTKGNENFTLKTVSISDSLSSESEKYVELHRPKISDSDRSKVVYEKTPFQKITDYYKEHLKEINIEVIANDSPIGGSKKQNNTNRKASLSNFLTSKIDQKMTEKNREDPRDKEEIIKEYNLDPDKVEKMIAQNEKFNRQFYEQEHLNKLFFEGDEGKAQHKISDVKVLNYYTNQLKKNAHENNPGYLNQKDLFVHSNNKLKNTKNKKINKKNHNLKATSIIENEDDQVNYHSLGNVNSVYPYLNLNNIPRPRKIMIPGQTKEQREIIKELIELKANKNNLNPFFPEFVTYSIDDDNATVLNQYKTLQSRLMFNKDLKKWNIEKEQNKKKEKKNFVTCLPKEVYSITRRPGSGEVYKIPLAKQAYKNKQI